MDSRWIGDVGKRAPTVLETCPEDGFVCEIPNALGCHWTLICKSRKWRKTYMSVSRAGLMCFGTKSIKKNKKGLFAGVEQPPRYSVRWKQQRRQEVEPTGVSWQPRPDSLACECVRASVVHAVQVHAGIGNSMENSGEVISRGVQDILKAKTSHRKKYVEYDPVRTSEIRWACVSVQACPATRKQSASVKLLLRRNGIRWRSNDLRTHLAVGCPRKSRRSTDADTLHSSGGLMLRCWTWSPGKELDRGPLAAKQTPNTVFDFLFS